MIGLGPRFPLYVYADEVLARRHRFTITFRRLTLPAPLYVALDVYGETEPESDGGGAIVFGGWGAGTPAEQMVEFAFVVTTPANGSETTAKLSPGDLGDDQP